MKTEIIGKVLIAIGIVAMIYAMSMPVSVRESGIVNIHLISERQNTLLLGGLMFIAGIILFAVFKLKQTKEESEIAEKHLQERTTQAKVRMESALHKTSEGASGAAKSVMERMNRGKLSIAIRLVVVIFVGLYSGPVLWELCDFLTETIFTDMYVDLYGHLLLFGAPLIIAIAYAFRRISTIKVVTHLALAFVLIIAVSSLLKYTVLNIKRDECSKTSFVSEFCMDLLYRNKY
jgi:hypothetical protein